MRRSKYRKWKNQAFKILSQRQRIQRSSIDKLQRKIASSVQGLNIREGFVRKWTFDEVSIKVLIAIFNPCVYCREKIHWKKWSLDHIKPVERGGTNKKKNIHVVCRRCNRAKGSVAHKPFLKILKYMRRYPHAYKQLLTRLSYGGSFHSHKR